MSTDTRTTTSSGPIALRDRAPGPDLARGVMLLLIALANTPFYLWGAARSQTGMHPADGSMADQVVQAVLVTAVDARTYPMFAFLFGYGVVMIYGRQNAHVVPEPDAFRLLQRRNLWLLAFGAVHALLLWGGDVLGAYGLCGLLLVWLFVRRQDRTLLVWAGLGVLVATLLAALMWFGAWALAASGETAGTDASMPAFLLEGASAENPLVAAGSRMTLWLFLTVAAQGPIGIFVPVAILLGFWAARHRVLERPAEHRRLLWTVAVVGIALGWGEGLVHALTHVGVLGGLQDSLWAFSATQGLSGLACGLGYAAVFGLVGARLRGRRLGLVGTSVSAVGRRSLSCYLAQSVLCAPVLAAWGLGLGEHLGSATMVLYALGVWLVTVVWATWLDRRDRPGPAETLLRRLTYRSPSSAGR